MVTAYVLHIPVGLGYIHLGDAFLYLAASLLPTPYALLAGAVGAGLADLLTAPEWVIATVIIKAIITLFFTNKKAKIINAHNVIALFISAVITAGGYYLAECIMFGNWVAPVAYIPANLIQAGGSVVVFLLLGLALDKAGFKQKVLNIE